MNGQNHLDQVDALLAFAGASLQASSDKRISALATRAHGNDLLERADELEQEASSDDDCGKRHLLVALLVRGVSPELRREMQRRRNRETIEPNITCPHSFVLEYRFAARQCLICQLKEQSVNGSPFLNLGDSRERYVHQNWSLDYPAKPASWPSLVASLIGGDAKVRQIFKDTGLHVDALDE